MRIVSIVGARPQFIKAAPVSRALREQHEEILVHSGQHFDHGMSQVFFDELGIPAPDYNLGVGGGTHGRMTGEMLGLLEELLVELTPDAVLVYGDTNTTLAGGLAAAKLNIPVAHVEAGLRSFNRSMPEEINRVVVDHVSRLLFCPTRTAVENLVAEGVTQGVELVGDVMLDTALYFAERVSAEKTCESYGVAPGDFYLATLHRQAASDDPVQLAAVVRAFARLDARVLWAVHPRTRKNLDAFGLSGLLAASPNVRVLDPLPYLEMNGLLRVARALLTDSGGMQKEAYFFGVPCITMREETEWVETVELGWNVLTGTDESRIVEAASAPPRGAGHPPVYGDGHAAGRIAEAMGQLYT
jgi:UDP-GlcNAc3NAcA epimerase